MPRTKQNNPKNLKGKITHLLFALHLTSCISCQLVGLLIWTQVQRGTAQLSLLTTTRLDHCVLLAGDVLFGLK